MQEQIVRSHDLVKMDSAEFERILAPHGGCITLVIANEHTLVDYAAPFALLRINAPMLEAIRKAQADARFRASTSPHHVLPHNALQECVTASPHDANDRWYLGAWSHSCRLSAMECLKDFQRRTVFETIFSPSSMLHALDVGFAPGQESGPIKEPGRLAPYMQLLGSHLLAGLDERLLAQCSSHVAEVEAELTANKMRERLSKSRAAAGAHVDEERGDASNSAPEPRRRRMGV
jgi:hypothetical protein